MALERADARERGLEVPLADVLLVELGVGAVQGHLYVVEPVRREALGDGLGDQTPVGDDLDADAARAKEVEEAKDVLLCERLAPGHREVIDVEGVEEARHSREELFGVGVAAERGAVVLAPLVVAVVALLVADPGDLDGHAVHLRATHGSMLQPGPGFRSLELGVGC